jgi:hypothetical protein
MGISRFSTIDFIAASKECSFLKKRTKKLLFLVLFQRWDSPRNKSLFASFSSEKEDSSSASSEFKDLPCHR